MLKTVRDDATWLITQPDHAQLSGYMAAHWGNETFAAPGEFAAVADTPALRAEVLLAVAEHDNGWWEWEAAPDIDSADGLPLGLTGAVRDPRNAMERWRKGIARLADEHPYASLLISYHAYWLYAPKTKEAPSEFLHTLFGDTMPNSRIAGADSETQGFLAELETIQNALRDKVREQQSAVWLESVILDPHVRLLQFLDALSLALTAAFIPPISGEPVGLGEDAVDFEEAPRRTWTDRVTIKMRPAGERRVSLDPFPFAGKSLEVWVPARVISHASVPAEPTPGWWRAWPKRAVRFVLESA